MILCKGNKRENYRILNFVYKLVEFVLRNRMNVI